MNVSLMLPRLSHAVIDGVRERLKQAYNDEKIGMDDYLLLDYRLKHALCSEAGQEHVQQILVTLNRIDNE